MIIYFFRLAAQTPQRLQAEGGKRGVTAANADHEKGPHFRTNQQHSVRIG
jgi:hypothetical protein